MKESRLDGMRRRIKGDHDVITNDKGQMSFFFHFLKWEKIYIDISIQRNWILTEMSRRYASSPEEHFSLEKFDFHLLFPLITQDQVQFCCCCSWTYKVLDCMCVCNFIVDE